MYQSFYQLSRQPFENDANTNFFFRSETHQASLLKLRYLIENHKGAGLLVGGSGSGKSFLTLALTQQLSEAYSPFVTLVYPQLRAPELLAYLAVELGAQEGDVGRGDSEVDRTIRQIELQLKRHAEQNRAPVIVVEDAQYIEDRRVFEALQLLLNFRMHHPVRFTLIISGDHSILGRIEAAEQLDDRLAVRCLLRPLTRDETAAMVAHRLKVAGTHRAIFDDSAIEALFEISGGIPRRINRLCDLAMLVGYADGMSTLSKEQIEAVEMELTTLSTE